jgi:diacylglycerol kinase family enzyme/membrane-associated phospholipid phosphatase
MALQRISDWLREADLRLFRKISGWRSTRFRWGRPKPATPLERLMLWLSLGANMSRIWFAAAAVLFKFGGRSGKRAGIRGLASIGATSAIVNFVIKPLVKRKRPARDRIPAARQLVREPLSTSFPSGHAASAFAFVSGVALESRPAGALLAPIAAAVAYSRTFNGVHYPLDVASGALIGSAVAAAGRLAWPDLPRARGIAMELPLRHAAPTSPDGSDVALVFNPASGSGMDRARFSVDDIRDLLPAARVIELSEGENPLAAARIAASSAPVVGVCGGDGTLAAAAQVAHESRKPLLVIPGGTMNHLAHDLGIREGADAATALRRGEAVEIDIATIDGQVFVNNVSFGAHTALVDERRRLERRLGRWPAQLVAATRVLRRAAPVDVVVNGERRSVWMAFLGNGTFHEAGIAPGWRSSLNNGTLDVRLLVTKRRHSRLSAVLVLLLSGLRRMRGLQTRRAQRVTLRPVDDSMRLSRDGETFETTGTICAEAHRRGLLVYAPAHPPQSAPSG